MAHGCSLFSLLSPHISQYVNVGEIFVNQFSFISSFDMPWSGCCGLCLGPHLQHGGTLFHRHGEGGWLLALGSLIQGTSFFIHALAKTAAWIERLMWVPFHPFGLQLSLTGFSLSYFTSIISPDHLSHRLQAPVPDRCSGFT